MCHLGTWERNESDDFSHLFWFDCITDAGCPNAILTGASWVVEWENSGVWPQFYASFDFDGDGCERKDVELHTWALYKTNFYDQTCHTFTQHFWRWICVYQNGKAKLSLLKISFVLLTWINYGCVRTTDTLKTRLDHVNWRELSFAHQKISSHFNDHHEKEFKVKKCSASK